MDFPDVRFITPEDGQGKLVVIREEDYLNLLDKLELYEGLLKGLAELDEEIETLQDLPVTRCQVRGRG